MSDPRLGALSINRWSGVLLLKLSNFRSSFIFLLYFSFCVFVSLLVVVFVLLIVFRFVFAFILPAISSTSLFVGLHTESESGGVELSQDHCRSTRDQHPSPEAASGQRDTALSVWQETPSAEGSGRRQVCLVPSWRDPRIERELLCVEHLLRQDEWARAILRLWKK